MKGVVVILAAAAIAFSTAWLASAGGAGAAGATGGRTLVVKVGDRIRVVDAAVGCRVARVRELHGRIAIDCRRAGALRGTFGTLLTDKQAALVQFRSKHTAKLVTVARHQGEAQQCEARR